MGATPKILSMMLSQTEIVRLRAHVDQRLVGLRVERYSWWQHWREIAEYLLPRRYNWLVTPNKVNRGSPINQRIIDSSATKSWRTLASGMMSGMTSPGRPWFRQTLEDQDLAEAPGVKLWLDQVTKRMERVFASSNFYNGMATLHGDLGSFGTAPMIIYEDFESVIRCYNPCAGEYYLAIGPRGDVDTFYREFVYTTYQCAKEFGVQNCSPTVQQAIRTGGAALTREIVIGHAIEPNEDFLPGAMGFRGAAYREIFWELGSAEIEVLRLRGFSERPFIAPRWDVSGNDAYGRSPAMDALGDIKQLQIEQKRKAQAIDKLVNPPMVGDVQLKNQPASLLPGGVTYVNMTNGNVGFRPAYEINPQIQHLLADIEDVRKRIGDTFFEDLFMMISQLDTVRTATEIDERKEEKLIQLGPVIERFDNEALDPSINRTFNIMLRKGLLPPIPDALRGQHIQIEYISMLSEAQKAAATASVERFAQFVGNIAGAVPDALDNVDWDEMIDEYAEMLGVSPKIVVPLAKVLQIRAQRAKQQAQQAQGANAMAAVQGAQVLSNTDVGGGVNALQKLTGNA
ncbi:head-to-tail connecting protein [Paraburkholderia sp. BL6665CI2N2]|uniref:portal protein n=1 Tax=Paraburkholderia sp. BL6665CI2N2 TaxID=1938806 RepID=UPI00106617DF|nr:portal protein [Paraburkholderia sp. BL6665CI2N2]TDY26291.1 head-to-tail connecting protein [Paraburkholderia sp. BL6665CI2N2]